MHNSSKTYYYLWHSSRGDVNYTASSSCRNFSLTNAGRPQWSCLQARPEEWPKKTSVDYLKAIQHNVWKLLKKSQSQHQPKLEFWFFVKNLNFPPKLNLWNQWELGPILVKKWDIFGDFATLWQFWRKSDTLIFLKSDQNMVIPIVFWPLLLATVGQAGGQKDIRSSSYFSYVLLMDKSD